MWRNSGKPRKRLFRGFERIAVRYLQPDHFRALTISSSPRGHTQLRAVRRIDRSLERNAAAEILEPVQHDVNLRVGAAAGPRVGRQRKDEPLAVAEDVVLALRQAEWRGAANRQLDRVSELDAWRRPHRHDKALAAAGKEELLPVARPQRSESVR